MEIVFGYWTHRPDAPAGFFVAGTLQVNFTISSEQGI
jgi:hypothetical protein